MADDVAPFRTAHNVELDVYFISSMHQSSIPTAQSMELIHQRNDHQQRQVQYIVLLTVNKHDIFK